MATFDAFIKIDGIPGESNSSKHKDEIEVLSYSWGIKHTGSIGGGGGGAGQPQVSDFTFLKEVGAASPALFLSVCEGKHIEEAVFTASGASGPRGRLAFYKLTFSDLFVSSVSPASSGNDVPSEQVSLSFSKVEIEYQDERGRNKLSSCNF
ncbi:MAG TPA: type VI secretion system tube protein Hcp [Vicinamibacteria bacterium]|nr:type VI secretion system tube protein Hcp [Vicinamibacteria bacterium]